YDGQHYLLEEHVNPLYRSLEAIRIHLDIEHAQLTELLTDLLRKNNMTTDVEIYLQVSRSSAPRANDFPEDVEPNILAYIFDGARHLEKSANGVKTITLPDERWDNCYVKSLNSLPNVLAKQTARENGCYEAILHLDG